MTPERRLGHAQEEAPDGASSADAAEDRRQSQDRRAGQDRRVSDEPYEGEDRRSGRDRRTGQDRRQSAGSARQDSDDDCGQLVQQDLEELAEKAEKADEYLALAQRTQADFENYRKRAARDASLAQDRGVAKLAKELLPALDNLDRALKAVSEDESQLAEGIKLVQTDLLSALQRVGVEPFSPQGEQFDPQLHEAVAQQPIDGVDSGLVAEVFQPGYRLGESVLRPARVLVAA